MQRYLARLFFILFFAAATALVQAQTAAANGLTGFEKMRSQAYSGNKWALRDIGTLLDDPVLQKNALYFLRNTSIFQPGELDWAQVAHKADFLRFFYENHERLRYDELLNAWYLTPLEQTKLVNFSIAALPAPPPPDKRLKSASQSLQQSIAAADTTLFSQSLRALGELSGPETWELLFQTARRADELERVFAPKKYRPRLPLLRAMMRCPENEALALALGWLQTGKITADEAEIPLSELSNHYLNTITTAGIIGQLRPLRDSLGSLAALRQHGFDALLPFEPYFFEEEADYYGHALAFLGPQPWARHNAMHSLAATQHPRSLYYLACRVYANRYESDGYASAERFLEPLLRPVEDLTHLKIAVPDAAGSLATASADHVWLLNYVRYWALHWPDYEWDEKRGHFINRLQAKTVAGEYERLFNVMTADTSTQRVLGAFRQLVEGDPLEIAEMAETYRQIARPPHPALPPLKQHFLEQMSALTYFCRENGLDWKPTSAALTDFIPKAERPDLSPAARFSLENQAIETLSLADATALEFEALVRQSNRAFGFSATRILHAIYARHWDALLADHVALRFYLKKSALFGGIGTTGACNQYLQRFNLNDLETMRRLAALTAIETDDEVQAQLQKLLSPLPDGRSKPSEAPENEDVAKKKFAASLDLLARADSLSADDFNRVVASPHYRPEAHKRAVLAALPRLRPLSQVRKLLPAPKFSGQTDLEAFADLPLTIKDLSVLPRLFDGSAPDQMLAFFWQKTSDLDPNERGDFFNEILRTDWLRHYLTQATASTEATVNVRECLHAWLDEAEEISEFQEENAQMHLCLLSCIGLPIAQKLASAAEIPDLEKRIRAKIQRELLANASFADLKSILPMAENLLRDDDEQPIEAVFNAEFGLPPLPFEEEKTREAVLADLAALPETEVYKNCLRRFGTEVEKPGGALDYQAIAYILRYELLMPFAGGGGERRDWCVFATVKTLEGAFKTRLGFHEKLNENQTFYTYNAAKRAAAWLKFLEEKGLLL